MCVYVYVCVCVCSANHFTFFVNQHLSPPSIYVNHFMCLVRPASHPQPSYTLFLIVPETHVCHF
jgi:hypothetical protein